MEFSLEVATLNQELLAWERTYNSTSPPGPPSPPSNSSLIGNTNLRRSSVTNLLDEYKALYKSSSLG